MPTLQIHIKQRPDISYPVVVQSGLFDKLAAMIVKNYPASAYTIITHKSLEGSLAKKLWAAMKAKKIKANLFSLGPGEQHKSMTSVESLGNQMVEAECDRASMIIALGGGIVGDTAGFLAATFMRGIDWINIPTSLLAMVDASIGGKVGVNSRHGKNMFGAFHHPRGVFIDPVLLKKLPDSEYLNGMVELIKNALVGDPTLVAILEKEHTKILARDLPLLEKIISRSLAVKKQVVEADEREGDRRMVLNYGHTLGHAIEKASKYQIKHGFAVAMGIALINEFSVQQDWLPKGVAQRILALFTKLGIDTKLPQGIKKSALLKIAQHDKKRRGNKLRFIILRHIGQAEVREGEICI